MAHKRIGDMSLDDVTVQHEQDIDKMIELGIFNVRGAAFARQLTDLLMNYLRQAELRAVDMAIMHDTCAKLALLLQGAMDARGNDKRADTDAVRIFMLEAIESAGRVGRKDSRSGVSAEFTEGAAPPDLMN